MAALGTGEGDTVGVGGGDRVDFVALSDNDPMCFFTPEHTQQLAAHIVNWSGRAVDYHLTTNESRR